MPTTLTFDLGTIIPLIRYILIAALFGIFAYQFLWPIVQILSSNLTNTKYTPTVATLDVKRKDSNRSSDQPPPEGFVDHLKIIEQVSPNASADVRWGYALAGLTEAEVAIAEAKLARKTESVTP